MVNQHEVELGDLQLGERIGFIKGGAEHQGEVTEIKDHPLDDIVDVLVLVHDDNGYPNCTRGSNIVWREVL